MNPGSDHSEKLSVPDSWTELQYMRVRPAKAIFAKMNLREQRLFPSAQHWFASVFHRRRVYPMVLFCTDETSEIALQPQPCPVQLATSNRWMLCLTLRLTAVARSPAEDHFFVGAVFRFIDRGLLC